MKKILSFFTEEIEDQVVKEETDKKKNKFDTIHMFNQEDTGEINLDDTQELGDIFEPSNRYEDTSEVILKGPEKEDTDEIDIPKLVRNQQAYEDTVDILTPTPKPDEGKESNYRRTYTTPTGFKQKEKVEVKDSLKKAEPKVVERIKRYRPTPFISPVHGILDPEAKQQFYASHKNEKRAVIEETTKYESNIQTYERIRNKVFSSTAEIEMSRNIEEARHAATADTQDNFDEYEELEELNVLEDVDFSEVNEKQTDIDIEGKIFFDLVDDDLEETKPNFLFTTQEIIGDDIKVTTIEDIDKAYSRDGVEYTNNDNRAVNPFENTDEIDRDNLLNLIDGLDDY